MDILSCTPRELVTKTIIKLQEEQPFFAHLASKLRYSLVKPEDIGGNLAGVDASGHVAINEVEWPKLDQSERCGLLCHEILHVVLVHLLRLDKRHLPTWNIAIDLVCNDIINGLGYKLPQGGIIPDHAHNFTHGKIKILKINEKAAEQIYDELGKYAEEEYEGKGGLKGKDSHQKGDAEGDSEKSPEKLKEKWAEAVADAATYAKQKGKLPAGMDRYIDNLVDPKLNAKELIKKSIIQTMFSDYTYAKHNKKSQSVIFPGVLKESYEVTVHIDTSGSITQEDFIKYMSEIKGLISKHRSLRITCIVCDMEIHDVFEINSKTDFKTVKIKGFGGTSHKPVWEWIKKNQPKCRLLVSFTDGCSDIEKSDKPRYPVVWVMNEKHELPFGKTVLL